MRKLPLGRLFVGAAITASLFMNSQPILADNSQAAVSPSAVAPGSSLTVSFSLELDKPQTVMVDVDVNNSSGNVVWNHQWAGEVFSSHQTRSYSTSWTLPANQAAGNYSLTIKAFNGSGRQVYANGGEAPFQVSSSSGASSSPTATRTPTATSTPTPLAPTPTAASAGVTSATASVSPTSVAQGSNLAITGTLQLPVAQTVTVNLDVTDATVNKVWNQQWTNQTFAAGQAKTFSATWPVPATQALAAYTITLKTFDSAGNQLFAQGGLAPFQVVSTQATPIASASPTATVPAGAITVTVDRTQPVGTSNFQLGVTPTQNDFDLVGGNGTAVANATSILKSSAVYQNAHIMGWGAANPEPSPGSYNFATLDTRMNSIVSTGGVPVITLCCAPGWMKADGQDWNMDEAPLASHYADFASLAKTVAQRYPYVKRFQVWNELKGFWDSANNRWDYKGYTTFYNAVYDAVRSVTPDAQIGGPYVVMDNNPGHQGSSSLGNQAICGAGYGCVDPRTLDVVTYWLANKHGASFVAVDGQPVINGDPFVSARYFADVTTWLRSKTSLPVWWSEWYATPWGGTEYGDAQQNAVMAASAASMITSGASTSLLWQPQADSARDDQSLWTSTGSNGGGQPFPLTATFQQLKAGFGPGTALYKATSNSTSVVALASGSQTLLVNTSSSPVTAYLNGTPVIMDGYGVAVQ